MTTLTDPLKIWEFGSNLQEHDLNFDNLIIHSRLKEFDKRVEDSGLSIKLAIKGKEHYIIDNQRLTISPGQYLLVNKHQQFDCYLKSTTEVEAFCLYLSADIVRSVYAQLVSKNIFATEDTFKLENGLPHFLEKVYDLEENELGKFLKQVKNKLLQVGAVTDLNSNDFYYTLAEKLLCSQLQINRQINRIESAKRTTRRELFKRLSLARNYIFDNFMTNIQLDDLSRVALLSKYHLLRTYKQVFGITPYQQVLKLRLETAKGMMQKDSSLEEIAFALGFSDRRSFTKAFKKATGISPSEFRRAS